MIVILGNLLDNAIEAVNRIETDVKKYIYMDIDFEMGSLWICIKNSYDNKLYVQENRFVTWKKIKPCMELVCKAQNQLYRNIMD